MPSTSATIDPAWAWKPFEPTLGRPWSRRLAAHLHRRAAFGASSALLDDAINQPPATVVATVVDAALDACNKSTQSDDFAQTVLATGDARQLSAWWVYVMLATATPLVERMTLFWHGHFATSATKVTDAGLVLEQNRLLRRRALGDFRPLAQEISRDPAMLMYLDSATNRKGHPNENFARELMELFCLGEGNYTEHDVRELARCFTGWEIKLGKFRFNRFQYDVGEKSIFGKRDTFADGTSIDWVLQQPQAAQFIAGKLYRQFVCDEPEPQPELIEPLARELRESDWQIHQVIRRILASELFFSDRAIGRKVRSPVDVAIGLLRSLEGTTNAQALASDLLQTGQGLFFPPNVKGWDGGRAWINSSTLLGRTNMVARLVSDEKTRFAGGPLDQYFRRLGATEPAGVVQLLDELLLAAPMPDVARESLVRICEKNPDRARGIAETIHALVSLPEFQLA